MTLNKDNTERTRTISWEDPKISVRDANAVSGLDYLKAIKAGKISPPPIARLVGYRIVDVENGAAVFEIAPGEHHYNPFSTVHGGILSTLLDTTMTAAVLSTLPIGKSCSTLEMKVNFVRPVTGKTGRICCRAGIIHSGSRIATASGKIFDDNERLVAHGISTCMIF
ncbi:MAG: PaaI family thioesterase [Desulfobacteraceae bacterium]|nr:PaaI family thioesterase [Desulfobacteraceae bacterium]MBC2756873.1 PaaI family thioesterase [Desulfobacteraceae bacterium]